MGWLPTAALAEIDVPLNGDNTKVTFAGSNPTGKHEGGFRKLTGSAKFEPADVTSLKLSIEIDMTSLYTDHDQLTSYLKSPDFFGVRANPRAKFVSTKVEKSGNDYVVTGHFTFSGRTKVVSFPARIEPYADGLVLSSSLSINRHEWGITYARATIDAQVSLTVAVRARK
jgi:polyisoprenoid-binding protein YceI